MSACHRNDDTHDMKETPLNESKDDDLDDSFSSICNHEQLESTPYSKLKQIAPGISKI